MSVTLSKHDEEFIYQLASELTGTCQVGKFRHEVLVSNVIRRIEALGVENFEEYLNEVSQDPSEYQNLLSALTIHTTSWFRELPHFERLEQLIISRPKWAEGKKFRILSAACSTGEECYSIALVLENARRMFPNIDYHIEGIDIDPISIKHAQSGVYSKENIVQIPTKYHSLLRGGSEHTADLFTLVKDIRSRCTFSAGSIVDWKGQTPYDLIVCRNVLIYFSPLEIDKIIENFKRNLAVKGAICLGHSETIDAAKHGLQILGNSIYSSRTTTPTMVTPNTRKSILVVDDSATMRKSLVSMMKNSEFDVSVASSADEASKLIQSTAFDLITLDLNMPGTPGAQWLSVQRTLGLRVPVVILSGASQNEACEVLGALEKGAQDYIEKGTLDRDALLERIRALTIVHRGGIQTNSLTTKVNARYSFDRPDLIVVGASTGGTEALKELLQRSPLDLPPVVISQHITKSFAKPFAERLADVAQLTLLDPSKNPVLTPGTITIPHEDHHIEITYRGGELRASASYSAPLNRHRPSVDYMFRSAARLAKEVKVCGIILTGMGIDGAKGLMELKEQGCSTIAQSEESCVVFGMPREAIKLGAAQGIGSPREIKEWIEAASKRRPQKIKK